VAQDAAAPQWLRTPDQRVYRAPPLCGSDSAGGRGPCGHRGRPATRATLPPRARQKGMVLECTHAYPGVGGVGAQRGVTPPPRVSPGAPRRMPAHANVIGCALAPSQGLTAVPTLCHTRSGSHVEEKCHQSCINIGSARHVALGRSRGSFERPQHPTCTIRPYLGNIARLI
jgi:hypothetical protein